MRIVTAVTTVGLVAGLGLTGAHLANASAYPSATPGVAAPGVATAGTAAAAGLTLPAGGVLEHRVTQFCTRVPELIKRADTAETRIGADADTKGSLARLKAHQAKATANQHPRVVNRLDRRIARRTARLAKLPELKTQLAKANAECATLDLPAPSSSPSASS